MSYIISGLPGYRSGLQMEWESPHAHHFFKTLKLGTIANWILFKEE